LETWLNRLNTIMSDADAAHDVLQAAVAAAAKGALQSAQTILNDARAEVGRLEIEKENAALSYLRARADEAALQYP
jgi:hypothetical protein